MNNVIITNYFDYCLFTAVHVSNNNTCSSEFIYRGVEYSTDLYVECTITRGRNVLYYTLVTLHVFFYLDIQNGTDYTSCATVTVVEGGDKNGPCIGESWH